MKKIIVLAGIGLFALMMLAPFQAQAALVECGNGTIDPENPNAYNPCGWDDVLITAKKVVEAAILYIAIPVGVILIIIGGFRMILSGGNEARFKEGQNMIKGVVIGFVITFLAWAFVSLLLTIFFKPQS